MSNAALLQDFHQPIEAYYDPCKKCIAAQPGEQIFMLSDGKPKSISRVMACVLEEHLPRLKSGAKFHSSQTTTRTPRADRRASSSHSANIPQTQVTADPTNMIGNTMVNPYDKQVALPEANMLDNDVNVANTAAASDLELLMAEVLASGAAQNNVPQADIIQDWGFPTYEPFDINNTVPVAASNLGYDNEFSDNMAPLLGGDWLATALYNNDQLFAGDASGSGFQPSAPAQGEYFSTSMDDSGSNQWTASF